MNDWKIEETKNYILAWRVIGDVAQINLNKTSLLPKFSFKRFLKDKGFLIDYSKLQNQSFNPIILTYWEIDEQIKVPTYNNIFQRIWKELNAEDLMVNKILRVIKIYEGRHEPFTFLNPKFIRRKINLSVPVVAK